MEAILVAIVPVLVAGLKSLVPKIPKNILPFVAVGFGLLGDVAWSLVTGGVVDGTVGVSLGLAGVGLREVYDQAKQAAAGV